MNDEQVARRVIRAVIQRARRMRYPIELLISPDDARAVLRAWRFAEASGIQFLGNVFVAEGTRFRIAPQMSDTRRGARTCAPPAPSIDVTFARDALVSAPAQERTSPHVAERLAA
jgi:hypothetical protein